MSLVSSIGFIILSGNSRPFSAYLEILTFLICILSHKLLTKCDYIGNADLSFRKLVL